MKNDAAQAMAEKLATMKQHIEELNALHAELSENQFINWAHVGDVTHYNDLLSQITDQYMKRGEFS